MIDLTPLDVRKKKGDFRRGVRGYDAEKVDDFLDLAADRLEELVRENTALKERVSVLSEAISAYRERERALNEALVSAQQLREEMRAQSTRDSELTLREARSEAERIVGRARDDARTAAEATARVQTQRAWYLRSFRAMIERQLGDLEQEEERLRELQRAAAEAVSEAASSGEATPAFWLASIDEEGEDR